MNRNILNIAMYKWSVAQ